MAALRRWIQHRFGASTFAALRLPGGALVDQGLADLAAERETNEGLLVSLARTRLRREGVTLPPFTLPDPDTRLYRSLGRDHGNFAYARYRALIE